MAGKIEFEATGGVPDETLNDHCRASEIKSLLSAPCVFDEGTVEIAGEMKSWQLTKQLPQKGNPNGDAVIQFKGVVSINGEVKPYSMLRTRTGEGGTTTSIQIDGKYVGTVTRTPPVREVVQKGTIEVMAPELISYEIRETLRPGQPALERDELEALIARSAAD